MNPLELDLFSLVNGPARQTPALDWLVRLFVGDYFVPVLLSLALLGLWFMGRDAPTRERLQRAVLVAILAIALANLLVAALNASEIVVRPRPFQLLPQAATSARTLFYLPPDPTFPSNSASVAFAIAGSVWLGHRRLALVLGALGFSLGLARVYAGVHFPLDVLGGMAIGLLASAAAYVFLERLGRPVSTALLRLARRLYLA